MADDNSGLFSRIQIELRVGDAPRIATATCKVAGAIYLTGIMVLEGQNGPFISMPSKAGMDVFFPANKNIRDELQELVLQEYRRVAGIVLEPNY